MTRLKDYSENPVDLLAQLPAGEIDWTNPDHIHAVSKAFVQLSYCRDTMSILEQKTSGKIGNYGAIRRTFESR